jgi:LmbE family N-acetylglucosaminyl deacetylase
MRWVYLSPHYDDAVLSCGGLIWEQVRAGETVEIWTIFSGDPPLGPLSDYAQEHHQRWGVVGSLIELRRAEDQAACAAVGASPRYFDLPDCIYRRLPDGEAVIKNRIDLFSPVHPGERPLINFITTLLVENIAASDRLVCPLSVGGHVDHRLVKAAVAESGWQAWYYADYPYTIMEEFNFRLKDWVPEGSYRLHHPLSQMGLAAWQSAVACYASQISTFWTSTAEMQAAIAGYAGSELGNTLWQLRAPENTVG